MPKIQYESPKWFERWQDTGILKDQNKEKVWMIQTANEILDEYEAQGYQLTLRQLYYQFVSRGLIDNDDRNYKKLGTHISDGRMLGLIDWSRLVDRSRNFEERIHWESPDRIVRACVNSFSVDRWKYSPNRFEVWVEKQALEDIVEQACTPWDVGYIACKGYMSQSEMWSASQRIQKYEYDGQAVTILHFGDHDPSGIDMTRDIQDRLRTFGCRARVDRIALTMKQVEQYNPPPNPAKLSDTRANDYIRKYGYESWELDALEPSVIRNLIDAEIEPYADSDYEGRLEEESEGTSLLQRCSDNWPDVSEYITDNF